MKCVLCQLTVCFVKFFVVVVLFIESKKDEESELSLSDVRTGEKEVLCYV